MINETICALATPAGGAIGIVRLSGYRAIEITNNIFRASSGKSLTDAHTQTLHYGNIIDDEGNIIDDVLVTVFHAPHSYTGENSTEISCHGSRYILNKVLQLLIKAGCHQAQPGEYTQRAFLNGKMDLSQAEAVADLIAATNSATHRIAMGQLRGNISTELSQLRDQLLRLTSLLELELDFSDHEDLEFANRTDLLTLAKKINSHISRLSSTFVSGHAIKQGIPVAIVGKTNVGKSTLLNKLVGEERAIVSHIHGTTRDVIEDVVDINGVAFRFIDTAGLRTTNDEIEQIGIELTYRKLHDATIILWLLDALPTAEECQQIQTLCVGKRLIVVNNKTDLQNLTQELKSILTSISSDIIGISARNATNIDVLRDTIFRLADIPQIHENDVILTSARHYDSLLRANESILRVIEGLEMSISNDLISEDLRICLDHLAEITGGHITTQDVLSNIFKNFCIGK